MKRLHISFNAERTTVAVDNNLSALLAIRLGHKPETPEAWRAVRGWLQGTLAAEGGHYRRPAEAVQRWGAFADGGSDSR